MFTLNRSDWSPVVPNTEIPRLEVVTAMSELREAVKAGHVDEVERLFLHLARMTVLTVSQLASLMDLSRQGTYNKLKTHGILYGGPPRAKTGAINPDYVHIPLSVVRVLTNNPSDLHGGLVQELKTFGTDAVVRHLVGVSHAVGTIV